MEQIWRENVCGNEFWRKAGTKGLGMHLPQTYMHTHTHTHTHIHTYIYTYMCVYIYTYIYMYIYIYISGQIFRVWVGPDSRIQEQRITVQGGFPAGVAVSR
jgi:hypothetical protein